LPNTYRPAAGVHPACYPMVNMARTFRDQRVSQQNHELAISTAVATTTITTTTTTTKPQVEEGEFLFSTLIQTGLEGPSSLLYNGYRCCCVGVNQMGRGVDQPHHLAPRLRMSTAIPVIPLCACMACFTDRLLPITTKLSIHYDA